MGIRIEADSAEEYLKLVFGHYHLVAKKELPGGEAQQLTAELDRGANPSLPSQTDPSLPPESKQMMLPASDEQDIEKYIQPPYQQQAYLPPAATPAYPPQDTAIVHLQERFDLLQGQLEALIPYLHLQQQQQQVPEERRALTAAAETVREDASLALSPQPRPQSQVSESRSALAQVGQVLDNPLFLIAIALLIVALTFGPSLSKSMLKIEPAKEKEKKTEVKPSPKPASKKPAAASPTPLPVPTPPPPCFPAVRNEVC